MTFKNKKHTEAHKRRMSKLFKGKLKLSKEAKEKIRKAHIGMKLSLKTKKKISKSLKGHKVTKETREKISKANKGKKNPFYGKTHTKEVRKKISKTHKGRKQSKEHIRKIVEAKKKS